MGPGMAATLPRGGMDVACFDRATAARDKTPGEVDTAHAVLERIGGPAAADRSVSVHADLAEALVADADLVIEAVPENAEVKAGGVRRARPAVEPRRHPRQQHLGDPDHKIQQSAVSDPSRVVGMHWSNPPHVIPVIEVIAGERRPGGRGDAPVSSSPTSG